MTFPRHKHPSCDNCTYLGSIVDNEGKVTDLYFCKQGEILPTVIARTGSDGEDYTSGLFIKDRIPELALAYKLAQEQKLI